MQTHVFPLLAVLKRTKRHSIKRVGGLHREKDRMDAGQESEHFVSIIPYGTEDTWQIDSFKPKLPYFTKLPTNLVAWT